MIAAADATLTVAAPHPWALSACAATAGAGLGLSSVAATTLGTTVPEALRGTASGIINTAAQLGTAVGIAALLLIADATTGAPGPGTGAPTRFRRLGRRRCPRRSRSTSIHQVTAVRSRNHLPHRPESRYKSRC